VDIRCFPGPDKKLKRPFAVHECCYDCVEFYHGCSAWPEKRPFDCSDYYSLPVVMPGTCGQVFPPSRMRGRKEPKVPQKTTAGNHDDSLAPAPAPARTKPASSHAGPRLCECGAALPKGKRLCESCRVQRRRQTMREYMRSRRATRRESDDGLDMHLFAATRHATHAGSLDLPLTSLPSGGARLEQTSV
jgi:hypothetical protein